MTPPATSTGPWSLRERLAIGASLLPPLALLMLAARWGWVPLRPLGLLGAMPLVLALGMLLPARFARWHRGLSRVQARLGRGVVLLLLRAIHLLAVVPLGGLMRLFGQRPVDLARTGSAWVRSKGYGSLRDPF